LFTTVKRKILFTLPVVMATMRAAVYDRTAPEGVRVDPSFPRAGPLASANHLPAGHVLVKVVAAGVNPVDAKKVIGDKLPSWMSWLTDRSVDGKVAGMDFAGIVEGVSTKGGKSSGAEAASSFQVGEKVYGILPPLTGAFTEFAACPASQLCIKPSSLSFTEAAALPIPGLTVVCF
jgi:NADPH:quinone reductase-like Zn-dependent oxidoreductase